MTSQQSPQLPFEVYSHLLSFRPTHPVAKLVRDFKRKFSYCVVCNEEPRFGKMKVCSPTCADANYCEYSFKGDRFWRFMESDPKDEE